jgi:DNA-binding transcriptional LysR family regulator
VLPRQSAGLYLSSLGIRAVTLDEPWVRRQLVVCVRSLEALSPAARTLVDHLAVIDVRSKVHDLGLSP